MAKKVKKIRKTIGIDPCTLPPRRRRRPPNAAPVNNDDLICLHEAWEDNGSSRRCADCLEYLGGALPAPAYAELPPPPALPPPFRHRMPAERQGVTHKFDIAGCEGYLTVGLFSDGTVGEIFLRMAKQGSTIGGFADAWATCFSMALQYGVPLERMCSKFTAWSFEPSGFTGNEDIPSAKSVIDYVSRWLMAKYGPKAGGGM